MSTRTENIANLLRDLRHQLGLSQQQLADLLGVSFRSVNRWENGHALPLPLAAKQIEKLKRQVECGAEALSLQDICSLQEDV